MARPRAPFRLAPPEPDLERRLAHRLYASRGGIEVGVLDALVASPRRYSEFRGLLRGRNDNVLSKGLRRLLDEGLIQQRGDPTQRPPAVAYELTSLGVAVRDVIVELRFADRLHAGAHRDARASASRG